MTSGLITQQRAITICAELSEPFHRAGYLLGFYGSCLTGTAGEDVDVLAVPWRRDADIEFLDSLLMAIGWKPVARDFRGLIAEARLYKRYSDFLDVRVSRCSTTPCLQK